MTDWALTVEEVRVVGLMTGLCLPPMLRLELGNEDGVLAEAFATRTLVARGLAVLTGEPGIALAPGAAARLAPLVAPAAVAEVEVDTGEPSRHVVVEGADGAVLALHEREMDIWSVDDPDRSLAEVIRDLVELPARSAPPSGTRLALPAPVLQEVERLARAGRWEAVDQLLASAAVDGEAAGRWRAARQQQWLAGSVRVRRTLAPDVYETAEVRWLDGGAGGMWRFEAEELDDEGEATIVIEDVGGGVVQAELGLLVGEAAKLTGEAAKLTGEAGQ